MPRKRFIDPLRSEKRKRSYRISQTEQRHHCRLGTVVEINQKYFLVALATYLFVYLIDRKGDYKKLSWQEWDKHQFKLGTFQFVWNKKVRETISFLKKKIKFEWRIRKAKEVTRVPKIRRFPVKKVQPIIRTPKRMKRRNT
jgi:hypothetical protein